jgi:hypothetical protein
MKSQAYVSAYGKERLTILQLHSIFNFEISPRAVMYGYLLLPRQSLTCVKFGECGTGDEGSSVCGSNAGIWSIVTRGNKTSAKLLM